MDRSFGTVLRRGGPKSDRTFYAEVAGGGGFSPDDIAGLEGWYRSDILEELFPGVYTDDSAVAEWPDDSGHARTLEQDTIASKRPVYKTNIINGKPVVRFTPTGAADTSDWMSNSELGSVFDVNDPRTDFVMMSYHAVEVTAYAFRLGDNGSPLSEVYTYDSSPDVFLGTMVQNVSSRFAEAAGPAVDTWLTLVLHWTGSVLTSYLNGVELASNSDGAVTAGTFDRFMLGTGNPLQAASLNYMDGDVAEFLTYSAALSDTDLNLVGNYLADKYALSWTDI